MRIHWHLLFELWVPMWLVIIWPCGRCCEWFRPFSRRLKDKKWSTFLWFGVHFSDDVEEGVWLFVGKEKIFDKGGFFEFEFFGHFLHVEDWIVLIKFVGNLELIKIREALLFVDNGFGLHESIKSLKNIYKHQQIQFNFDPFSFISKYVSFLCIVWNLNFVGIALCFNLT